MRIGILAQPDRVPAAEAWLAEAIAGQLAQFEEPIEGFSSLAAAAERSFAAIVLDRGGMLFVVVPLVGDEAAGSMASRAERQRLARRATEVFELGDPGDASAAWRQVDRYIVDSVHTLLAVWDGQPGQVAEALGYARRLGRPVLQLDPVSRRIHARI
jgi:hypothetical protein